MFETIQRIQNGDKNSFNTLIERFYPALNKYSRLSSMEYDDAMNEFLLKIYQLTIKIDLVNFTKLGEGAVINYYVASIKNHYINLNTRSNSSTSVSYIEELTDEVHNDFEYETKLLIKESLDKLSPYQRDLITKIYFYGFSEVELSKEYNVTRQAISNAKIRSLKKLKHLLIGG